MPQNQKHTQDQEPSPQTSDVLEEWTAEGLPIFLNGEEEYLVTLRE